MPAAGRNPGPPHGLRRSASLQAHPQLGDLTAYRYSVSLRAMIRSFGDKRTEALFRDEFVRQFQGIARPAKRKLEALNAASRLEDLMVPPSNRLEKLKGDLKDFHSIRVNDQWRVIFKWIDGEPDEVRIVDVELFDRSGPDDIARHRAAGNCAAGNTCVELYLRQRRWRGAIHR